MGIKRHNPEEIVTKLRQQANRRFLTYIGECPHNNNETPSRPYGIGWIMQLYSVSLYFMGVSAEASACSCELR